MLLVFIQLIPLSPSVLKTISPNTHQLYKQTLPGYDTSSKILEFDDRNSDIKPTDYSSGFSTSNFKLQTSNYWKPLSLYPYATRQVLLKVLMYATIFFLITNTRSLRPKNLVMSIIISGFLVSLTEIIRIVSGAEKIYWFCNVTGPSPMGPFTYRGYFASYMAMAIPLALGSLIYYLSFYNKGKKPSIIKSGKSKLGIRHYENDSSKVNLPVRDKVLIGQTDKISDRKRDSFFMWFAQIPFLVIVTAMMSTTLFLSLSRGGMVANVLSLLFLGLLLSLRKPIRKGVIYLLPVIVLMFVALAWVGINPVTDRLSTLYETEENKPGITRLAIWNDTGNMISDYPVFGTGLGTFRYIYPKYRDEALNYLDIGVFPVRAHNDYLEMVSVMGIPGLVVVLWGCYRMFKDILFCHILGRTNGIAHVMPETVVPSADPPWWTSTSALVRDSLRRRNPFVLIMSIGCLSSILAIICQSFTDFVLHSPAIALLFFVILGLACRIIHDR